MEEPTIWEAVEPPDYDEEDMFPPDDEEDEESEDPYYVFEERDFWTEAGYLGDD
jgi:hypothetical protein